MKEITRIHIAKIPYEIEVAAKKELEIYLKALEAYSDDAEIIQDVEIRMTEILTERGVKKDGIISHSDIQALREQLGEPHEFGEGDITIGPSDESSSEGAATRKLYRDPSDAVFGGVLSGIAKFFQVNPLWIRLIFIIVAFASFGTALLVYIVLWIAVPPAKTAADRLQMSGRPVTVYSIREFNENEATKTTKYSLNGRSVMMKVLGSFSILGALGVFAVTILIAVAGELRQGIFSVEGLQNQGIILAAFILCIVSGLLLTVLLSLTSVSLFTQKLTRRIAISGGAVIVLGLMSFGTAIGLVQYADLQHERLVTQNTHNYPITLPEKVKLMTALKTAGEGMIVEYHVTADKPTAYLRIVDDKGDLPKVTTSLDGTILNVTTGATDNRSVCVPLWACNGFQKTLVINGPALTALTIGENSSVSYHPIDQADLKVMALKSSRLTFKAGKLMHASFDIEENADIDASDSTISQVDMTVKPNSDVSLGTVQALSINDDNSCPSDSTAHIGVWNVTGGGVIINGITKPVDSATFACSKLSIRNKEQE